MALGRGAAMPSSPSRPTRRWCSRSGFDTFERDPIGDLALRTADYGELGRMVAGAGLPVVALQEGGYAIDAIGANARAFLRGLRGEDA